MPILNQKRLKGFSFKMLFISVLLINLKAYSQIVDFKSLPKCSLETDLKNMVGNPSIVADSLIRYIKTFKSYPSLQNLTGSHIFSINDSTFGTIPFKLHIPKNYKPNQSTPLILLLRGGVGGSSFSDAASSNTKSEVATDPFYQKLCNNGFLVIMPFGDHNKNFNWAMNSYGKSQNLTYSTLIKMIVAVKKVINVDENKIFAFGHSDGSDGVFALDTYLPTTFAGFVGYNSMLNILFGNNLYIANTINHPLYLVHSDKDDLRPIEQTRAIIKLLYSLKSSGQV